MCACFVLCLFDEYRAAICVPRGWACIVLSEFVKARKKYCTRAYMPMIFTKDLAVLFFSALRVCTSLFLAVISDGVVCWAVLAS